MKATKADFAVALGEVSSGKVDEGLFTMALSQASGNQDKAAAIYLALRAGEVATERAMSPLRSAKAMMGACSVRVGKWYEHLISVIGYTLLIIIPVGLLYGPTVYVLHVQDSMTWCTVIAIIFLCISVWLADIVVRRREMRARSRP
jgi:hypothetical protein